MQFVPVHRHTDNIVDSHCHCQWVQYLHNFSLLLTVAVWCTVSDSLHQTSQIKKNSSSGRPGIVMSGLSDIEGVPMQHNKVQVMLQKFIKTKPDTFIVVYISW